MHPHTQTCVHMCTHRCSTRDTNMWTHRNEHMNTHTYTDFMLDKLYEGKSLKRDRWVVSKQWASVWTTENNQAHVYTLYITTLPTKGRNKTWGQLKWLDMKKDVDENHLESFWTFLVISPHTLTPSLYLSLSLAISLSHSLLYSLHLLMACISYLLSISPPCGQRDVRHDRPVDSFLCLTWAYAKYKNLRSRAYLLWYACVWVDSN